MVTVTMIRQGMQPVCVQAEKGVRLIDILTREGVPVNAPCGGRCFCGKCVVEVKGNAGPIHEAERRFLSEDDLLSGKRLACAATVEGEMTISVDVEDASILVGGAESTDPLKPSSEIHTVTWPEPTLIDPRGDEERVLGGLGEEVQWDIALLRVLPEQMRANESLNIALHREANGAAVTQITPGPMGNYGVAVDIGTTTLAAYLVNLNTGEQLGTASALNPQRAHGGDVISRVDYTIELELGLTLLAALVREQISALIGEMAAKQGISPNDVRHIVLVGNTIMMHILAALEPKHIAVLPFTPLYTRTLTLPAAEIGLPFPNARATLGPCVAGYVGADTVAAVLACDMDEKEELSLLIDIGTNGEIVLGDKNRLLTCAAAAGPAFEGAHIRCGSGAVKGAIDHVYMQDGEIAVTTIGGVQAQSICGSGLVDAIAAMLKAGIIDETGRIDEDEIPEVYEKYLIEVDGKCAVKLSNNVFICQKDVREVQLAKGAIAAGVRILVEEMGVKTEEITHLYLAGGFGNFIDQRSACEMGLLPKVLLEKIVPIGNGAGAGAKRMLMNRDILSRAEEMRKKMEYIELSTKESFQELFSEEMMFE